MRQVLRVCTCRSKAALQMKLEARKKKRQGAEVAKFSKQMQMEEDALQKKNLLQKAQESQLMGDNSANKTETSDVLIGNLPKGAKKPDEGSGGSSGAGNGLGVTLTGNMEQDWVNLLMASPLFKQINDLEEMLDKTDTSDEVVTPHIKG